MPYSYIAVLGLSPLDLIVIIAYFVAMIGIGIWSMRRIKSQEDFFLGGRRFGRLIQVFANFGQATSSDTGPTVATTTYNNGGAGVWSALMMLFATPFFWFTSVWYRRMRTVTLGDYYAERFNSKVIGGIYALLMGVGLCVLLSLAFIMMNKTVQAMTPKDQADLTSSEKVEYAQAVRMNDLQSRDYHSLTPVEVDELRQLQIEKPRLQFSYINSSLLIWSIVIVVCLYAVTGGLEAAFISDMIQGVFILILSVMLIPFAVNMVNDRFGGSGVMDAFRTLHVQKSESFFEIFGSPAAADFTWYYIAAIAVMGLINSGAQANTFVTPSSSKDEYSARFGMTFGIYLKRGTTVLWGVTSLFAVLLFASDITDPDLLWGYASLKLLAPVGMGLVGLMIAALMAALMSTADMFMITASSLFTHNIYRPLFPARSSKHYVNAGRVFGVLVLIGAAFFSLLNDSVLGMLKLWWEFGGLFAAAMWLGILWKKTSRRAVYFQIGTCLLLYFLIPMLLPALAPGVRSHPEMLKTTEARVITSDYKRATQEDVDARNQEIESFRSLTPTERAGRVAPVPVELGQPWSKTTVLPAKSIFWTKGLVVMKDENGEVLKDVGGKVRYQGQGMLNVFLYAVDALGFDLSKNTYSENETIRVAIRVVFPFLILVGVSLLTRRSKEEIQAADRLAARMLTPLAQTPEEDEKEVELSHARPGRFDHTKVFGPESSWQWAKWNRQDTVGFILNILTVIAIIWALTFCFGLGG
ncbi:MAG: sodium:solute symporter family protein [Akkermansiaceae bacterium]|nr:sodium:solute symporter family protein [Akkermansiaceae bacterium]